jgi:hypothetical protein
MVTGRNARLPDPSPMCRVAHETAHEPFGCVAFVLRARYASIVWRGAERLDRRYATPKQWKAIALDLQLGLPSLPLDATSSMVTVLLDANRGRGLVVQYMNVLPIEVERAQAAATRLEICGGGW